MIMRTIQRDIVGGYVFSKDGKLLLGKNCKGGVFEGFYVVPAGGIEVGETKEAALKREILEETGIDITGAKVTVFLNSCGESEKTLPTGERVWVRMNFFDYRIDLTEEADKVRVITLSDWVEPRWFTPTDLRDAKLADPIRNDLLEAGVLNSPASPRPKVSTDSRTC